MIYVVLMTAVGYWLGILIYASIVTKQRDVQISQLA